jgi:transposase
MKKRNVFQNQSQEILALFEMAKDRSKVMCIPIDYAKKDHLAMIFHQHPDSLEPF